MAGRGLADRPGHRAARQSGPDPSEVGQPLMQERSRELYGCMQPCAHRRHDSRTRFAMRICRAHLHSSWVRVKPRFQGKIGGERGSNNPLQGTVSQGFFQRSEYLYHHNQARNAALKSCAKLCRASGGGGAPRPDSVRLPRSTLRCSGTPAPHRRPGHRAHAFPRGRAAYRGADNRTESGRARGADRRMSHPPDSEPKARCQFEKLDG